MPWQNDTDLSDSRPVRQPGGFKSLFVERKAVRMFRKNSGSTEAGIFWTASDTSHSKDSLTSRSQEFGIVHKSTLLKLTC